MKPTRITLFALFALFAAINSASDAPDAVLKKAMTLLNNEPSSVPVQPAEVDLSTASSKAVDKAMDLLGLRQDEAPQASSRELNERTHDDFYQRIPGFIKYGNNRMLQRNSQPEDALSSSEFVRQVQGSNEPVIQLKNEPEKPPLLLLKNEPEVFVENIEPAKDQPEETVACSDDELQEDEIIVDGTKAYKIVNGEMVSVTTKNSKKNQSEFSAWKDFTSWNWILVYSGVLACMAGGVFAIINYQKPNEETAEELDAEV